MTDWDTWELQAHTPTHVHTYTQELCVHARRDRNVHLHMSGTGMETQTIPDCGLSSPVGPGPQEHWLLRLLSHHLQPTLTVI